MPAAIMQPEVCSSELSAAGSLLQNCKQLRGLIEALVIDTIGPDEGASTVI